MLWVDKHRPSSLSDLSYHDSVTTRLTALAQNPQSLPHLFVYGPSGSGKKTRIMSLLKEIYGNGATKLKLDKRTFTTPSKKQVEVNMISSNYHIELCPGDAGLNDRFVVQQVIKEIASTKSIASASNNQVPFKVVVLSEVNRLSTQAQAALRRTMEKYSSTCRLILVCHSATQVMEPVRSRCLGIRIPAPTVDQISQVLVTTAKQQGVVLPDSLAVSISRESSRNVRRALLMLQAMSVRHSVLDESHPIIQTDWELYIQQLAMDITKEQSPQRLLAAREKLYELLVNCIPASVIIQTLVKQLLPNLDDSLKVDVLKWAAFYEHRIAKGSNKEIFHLEAFVAKYMALYKRYLTEMMDSWD